MTNDELLKKNLTSFKKQLKIYSKNDLIKALFYMRIENDHLREELNARKSESNGARSGRPGPPDDQETKEEKTNETETDVQLRGE